MSTICGKFINTTQRYVHTYIDSLFRLPSFFNFKYSLQWCELKRRKEALLVLFEGMRQYQLEEFTRDINAELPEDVRLLSEEDIAGYNHISLKKEKTSRTR